MIPLVQLTGLVAPLDRSNVDTDVIIPKQFLKSIRRTGFGPNLFDAWRYLDEGYPDQDCHSRPKNPDFVLNQARYQGAEILLTRENFGCGSSREHAPWALGDFGFRIIIASSFADIFFNNCFKNGILPIILAHDIIEQLFVEVNNLPGYRLVVNLREQTITTPTGAILPFVVDEFRRYCLLNGLDDIGLTLRHQEDIRQYEQRRKQQEPWIFGEVS